MLKNKIFSISLLFIGGIFQPISAQERPNIIVFLVDDLGWVDTSLPFGDNVEALNKVYHTPNMVRLAEEGVKFTNAYATPVCTPTRISMMTGMNAAHHGVTNWTSPMANRNTDAKDDQFLPAHWNINGLSNSPETPRTIYATTFPELLKDAGYYTVHVGKAHWGAAGTPGANPLNLGFMVNVSGHSAGHPQNYLAEYNYGNMPQKAQIQAVPGLQEYYGTDTFLTEALTIEAIKAIEVPVQRNEPFLLHIAHYAVHEPIMADKRFLQKYLDTGLDSIEASYATLIEGMDKSLGDIMDYLSKKGIKENTIILFMSDNGGLSMVPPRSGQEHSHNLPLKAGKGSVYEGGIRVPMIVKWPGVVPPGSVANQPVIIEDFFPSILEMAGLENYKTIQQIDGKSFVSILKDPQTADKERAFIWHYPNKWQVRDNLGINYKSAIRKGDWKMIYNMRDGSKELYKLSLDIGEAQNIAQENPEVVKKLSAILFDQLTKWKAPMPVLKSTGQPLTVIP